MSNSFVLRSGVLALLAVYGAWAWVSISQGSEDGRGPHGRHGHHGPHGEHHASVHAPGHPHPEGPLHHGPGHDHGHRPPLELRDDFPFDMGQADGGHPRLAGLAAPGMLTMAEAAPRPDTLPAEHRPWLPRHADGSLMPPPGARPPILDLRAAPVPAPSFIDADGRGRSAWLPPLRLAGPPGRLMPRDADHRPLEAREGDWRVSAGTHAAPIPGALPARLAMADQPPHVDASPGQHPPEAGPHVGQAPDQDASRDELRVTAAAGTASVVYTPAQIRQAYGLDLLPAADSLQGAYQGAGQVIVIVMAYHHVNLGTDLNAFSQRFGLPTCTVLPPATSVAASAAAIVDKPRPGEGCSLQWVYANAAGNQTVTTPPTDSNWELEAALDVQWAHATAPLAKIVIVEAASNSWTDSMGAIQLAAKLPQASVVSMSFGIPEWNTSPSYDALMSGPATWVAASGDAGRQVNYPAVSKNVLSVGGTYLASTSPRSETAWASAGGGVSAFHSLPEWQYRVSIPGYPQVNFMNLFKLKRAVPDVAFNASEDSSVYVTSNGTWMGMSGTSAAAPQWAGIVAVVNAVRVAKGLAPFKGTEFQQALYRNAANSNNYSGAFYDVTSGSNGAATCLSCKAGKGFDMVTGLGTPQVPALVNVLSAL